MDGVPGRFCPARPSSANQIHSRAMFPTPPSAPPGDVLALRVCRHTSRKRRAEPTPATGAENASQTNADRKLKLGDVLVVLGRLVASHEHRAAMLLVEELASSGVAESELRSTLDMFNRQLVGFVNRQSTELSKRASDCIQCGGQTESNTKTEAEVGMRARNSCDSTASTRSGSNPVPDRASDFIQRGGQTESSTKTEVEAGRQTTNRYDSKASTRSVSEAGGSMRRSVLQFCRRARNLTRRQGKVTSFSSVSEQENPEAFPLERISACSESSRGGSQRRASNRYSCTNIMIEASNRQREVREQSYDGLMPSARSTRGNDPLMQ